MSTSRILTSMSIFALGLIVGICGLAEAQTLSGIVYEGNVGNETKPLSGVTVKLYCSSNADELGELKASAATNVYGWYGLQVPPGYQFYNIVQEDLPTYASVGAASVSGSVKNHNWIQYQQSLDGKTLSGNKFWDRPKPANSPPNANAGPDQTVECACRTAQGTNVVLDGSGTTDPDGDPLTYTWTGPFLGSPASGSKPRVTLSGECLGPHAIILVVNDGQVDSLPDTVVINVVDTRAPVVDAGPDINVGQQSSSGTTVILNGSALDNCDPQLNYQWIEDAVILGQSATLTHDFGLGAHALTLKAVDDSGNAGTDTVVVSIVPLENMPDLTVTDIWSENETIYYQIMNVGGSVAPQGHYVGLFVDGEYKAHDLVSQDLQPGQRLKGRFHWSWQCTALEDNILIEADYEGSLAESNEENNQRQESWKCDTIPPAILLGPIVRSVSQSTAVIYWDTSEDSNSVVKYDKVSGRYGFEEADSALSKRHTITLTGLEPSTVYHFVVQSSDLSGNTTASKDCTFETRCSADNSDPSVRILDPGQCAGRAKITAFADDDVGVRKVEFYVDDEIVFTDFSSPYEHYLDTTKHVNGKHTLGAKAYDISGRTAVAARTIDIFNPPPDSNSPSIEIVSPGQGATVSGIVDIKVQATDPPSQGQTPPVLQPVNRVEFYIDGVYRATGYPVVYMTTYSWNTQTTAVGNRTITATAYDDAGNSASDSITVNVEGPPPPEPVIVVTRGPVERDGTAFTVCLDVDNTGDVAASNIEILDYVRGFQAFRYGPPVVTYNPATRESEVHLTVFDLAAHSFIRLGYYIVPILFEDDTSYAIGTHTDLSYQGSGGGIHEENLSIPASQARVNPGDYRNIANATEYAIGQADYLIVTNQARTFGYAILGALIGGGTGVLEDMYNLGATMAHLAYLKQGVLGYLNTYDGQTLRNLIKPDGDWAIKLHPDFSEPDDGYLLIVGETEVVPAWNVAAPPNIYATLELLGYDVSPTVSLTDHPYADPDGSGRPNLAVGRIIGNTPAEWTQAIQTSIGVHEGLPGYDFDRTDALLISGTGVGKTAMRIDIWQIGQAIDGEFNVDKLHWQECSDDDERLQEFLAAAPGKDLIYFCGHGSPTSWSPALGTSDLEIDLGSNNPLVFSSACLTGSYEDHSAYGGADSSIAEAFFGSGAAVYIGSTEISLPVVNHLAAWKFFRDWDASESVGKTLLSLERDRWGGAQLSAYLAEAFVYWILEYNLYGDPKFGAVETSASAASVRCASADPPASLDVVVPGYQVTTIDGVDYVEIPDGDILPIEGKAQVPCWSVSIEYPKGYNVQDVVLTDRSGLVTDTGLNLPITTYGAGSLAGDDSSEPPSSQGQDWFPEQEYSWGVVKETDGSSTLAITMYPFYYNALTTDVKFYKNYSFDIDYTVSAVAISSLSTDKNEYEQADTVIVDVELNNSGPAQDVIVNAVVKRYGSAEIVDGLLLESLKELTGPACFSPEWGSNESEPGYYCVEVTLKNTAGNVLDRKSEMFRMGISSGEITYFTAAPEYVQVGNDVTINMTFENTGTVNITGYARIKVLNSAREVIGEFVHDVNGLLPSESVSFSDIWSVSEAGPCKIMGYVSYDSKSTAPAIVEVNKECFPNGYSTYNDWVTLGKPNCWCAPPHGSGYQCDGDADGKDSGGLTRYRVFTGDLSLIVANWKKKAGDATLDPCADIDHKDSGGITKYRVFTGDLSVLVANWKKKETQLPGNCPRPE
jgi:hypothetical protein